MGQPIDTAEVLIVPDFSDFGREVNAGVERALRGVQVAIQQAFGRIESAAAQAGHEVGSAFQLGGERAESAFRETSSTARREFAEIDVAASASAAGISAKLGGALALVKTSLIGVGIAAGAGLAALTGFGLKSAASLEQSTVAFTSLLHSADDAKTFLADLQQFAAETPFEFQDVVGASQRLLVLTQSLGQTKDAVVPLLTTIGDLVSVTGGSAESIDSVVRALSQMASKGKISQEEIMQLAEALPGFNANAAIASSLGLSTADTLAKISAGGVDATTGINALIEGMKQFPGAAGAMAMQAQTLTGVFSTFKDTIGIALTGAFQPVIPEIKSALADLTPVLGNAIGQLAPSLGKALAAILPILGKLVEAIVPILMPILDALGPVLDALGPALVPLGEAIGQVLVALAPVLPVLAQFIAVLAELAVPILKVLAAVLTPLTPVLNYMARAIAEVAKALGMVDWTAVGSAIGGAFSDAWHAVADFFGKVVQGWLLFHDMVIDKIDEFKANVVAGFNLVVQFVKDLPGKLLDAASNFISTLVQSGKDLVLGLWNGITGMGGWLWGKVSQFVSDNILGPIKAKLGIASPSTVMAEEVGKQIPAGIEQGIRAGLPSLESLASPIVPVGQQGGAAGLNFGGITVTINFVGGTPSIGEAQRVGQAAGDGIMQAIARRNVGLAVRMGVAS
jgi:tape measure domain-containing protein